MLNSKNIVFGSLSIIEYLEFFIYFVSLIYPKKSKKISDMNIILYFNIIFVGRVVQNLKFRF